jgi:endonuclease/exonuclease/phosphatase family metal-dependent hydrolase
MHLKVLSYNIHRAIGVDRRFRPDRIVEILAHHDADLVLLQEVDDGVPRSRGMNLGRELALALGYQHLALGHNVHLRRGKYGNATLSRYPIVRESNIDLTIETRKRRGCLHTGIFAEVRSGHGHLLEVFNTHLGLSTRERVRQVGRLVQSTEFAALSRRQACILGGDFNDWRSILEPVFTDILDFRSASGRKYGSERAVRTYPSFSPSGALDRIYFRGSLRLAGSRSCRMKISRVASDHLPLIADFELH